MKMHTNWVAIKSTFIALTIYIRDGFQILFARFVDYEYMYLVHIWVWPFWGYIDWVKGETVIKYTIQMFKSKIGIKIKRLLPLLYN